MFEIESKKPDEITITTKKTSVTVNVAQYTVDGNLSVGKIEGPGEFEIGDVTIRAIDVSKVTGVRSASSAERSSSSADAMLAHGTKSTASSGAPSSSQSITPEAFAGGATRSASSNSISAMGSTDGQTIYDVEVGGVHIGIIGECEDALDELGMADILCTSSVRAVREIEPKLVIAMGNIDGMVTELKLSARTEKKLKVKNAESLPVALGVVALS